MTERMECRRAEELLSDHLDGTLAELLRADVEVHLRDCAECRALERALEQVVSALRTFPMLEAPAGLAERAANAALVRARLAAAPRSSRFGPLPMWLQTAAAALLLASGILLLAPGPSSAASRAARRLVERTANTAVYLGERSERLLEDFRILSVVVSTAFEGRLDRMNDRVDDYRRLLERRRASEQRQKKSEDGSWAAPVSVAADDIPLNLKAVDLVTISAQSSPRASGPFAARTRRSERG